MSANSGEDQDEVRRQETQRLKRDGYEEVLRHSRYCFLKNESNLTDRQALKLEELLQYDLKSVRAYLLKESFQGFWQYSSPYWAERFLRLWCARAMRSKGTDEKVRQDDSTPSTFDDELVQGEYEKPSLRGL